MTDGAEGARTLCPVSMRDSETVSCQPHKLGVASSILALATVSVAQQLERSLVTRKAAGANPTRHPTEIFALL